MKLDNGLVIEGTLGYIHTPPPALGGTGSEAFETLRAYYGIIGVARAF